MRVFLALSVRYFVATPNVTQESLLATEAQEDIGYRESNTRLHTSAQPAVLLLLLLKRNLYSKSFP